MWLRQSHQCTKCYSTRRSTAHRTAVPSLHYPPLVIDCCANGRNTHTSTRYSVSWTISLKLFEARATFPSHWPWERGQNDERGESKHSCLRAISLQPLRP